MTKAIAGFFRTQAEGDRAKENLYQAGFTPDQVSFLARDTRAEELPKVGPAITDAGTESEAGTDAFIGGAVGLAAGIVAVVLPPLGPLLALGPLAGAIGGLTAGAAAGGLIGLLKDHGVSEKEAEFYAEGVSRGGALITVHGVDEKREKEARKILDKSGAIGLEELTEEWRRSGWTGTDSKTLRAS